MTRTRGLVLTPYVLIKLLSLGTLLRRNSQLRQFEPFLFSIFPTTLQLLRRQLLIILKEAESATFSVGVLRGAPKFHFQFVFTLAMVEVELMCSRPALLWHECGTGLQRALQLSEALLLPSRVLTAEPVGPA